MTKQALAGLLAEREAGGGAGGENGAGGSNFKKGIYNKTRYLSGGCLI